MAQRYLVTGGAGFLGSYITRNLVRAGLPVTVFEPKSDLRIMEQVLGKNEMKAVHHVQADIADYEAVHTALVKSRATHIIHLAGLQVPTCRTDPLLGARVNVMGTLHVFEAALSIARAASTPVPRIVYASSAGVCGPADDYHEIIRDSTLHRPRTHYGVFKLANEGNARIYWQDQGISSIGLRPLTVYGVGRELGLTSSPTKAIKAALVGRKFEISFSGPTCFNFVSDVAEAFIRCAQVEFEGAAAFDMRGDVATAEEYLQMLLAAVPEARGLISMTPGAPVLPIAHSFAHEGIDALLPDLSFTSLAAGIEKTYAHFKLLHGEGRLHTRDLD